MSATLPEGYSYTDLPIFGDVGMEADNPDLPRIVVQHSCGCLVIWSSMDIHDNWHRSVGG